MIASFAELHSSSKAGQAFHVCEGQPLSLEDNRSNGPDSRAIQTRCGGPVWLKGRCVAGGVGDLPGPCVLAQLSFPGVVGLGEKVLVEAGSKEAVSTVFPGRHYRARAQGDGRVVPSSHPPPGR